MPELVVGVRSVSLFVRHSRSLKDKRQITKSLVQKLRNEGFSAVEYGYAEDHKRAMIGFSFVAGDGAFVTEQLDKAKRLFVGDYQVLDTKTELIEFGDEIVSDSWEREGRD